MFETFMALLAAHLVADFVLQFDWIAKAKQEKSLKNLTLPLTLHASIVGITTIIAIGAATLSAYLLTLIIVLSHIIIDIGKIYLDRLERLNRYKRAQLWIFWIDQIFHVALLLAAAKVFESTLDDGFWWLWDPDFEILVLLYIHITGFITVTRVGQFSIAMFMTPFKKEVGPHDDSEIRQEKKNSPSGGAWIGLIERSIIYGLVFLGQIAAIGVIIAIKSLLRFKETKIESEYLIIGTLISVTWAYAIAHGTKMVIELSAGSVIQ